MDRNEFFDMFSGAAKEQQKRYGIPASVTLAQMLLESGCGTSKLAREANNFFGIKQHNWKGEVTYADDDKKHEAFRKYDNITESIEDHSKFLMQKRYAKCRELSPTDYEGWAKGLKAAGYATDPKYADSLIKLIKLYKLDRYDLEAQMEAESEGIKCGVKRQSYLQSIPDGINAGFGMPLRGSDTLTMTSDFGHRNISGGSTEHEGIDLRASKGTAVYASEDGIVIGVGKQEASNGKAGGGNYTYVAYPRADGSFRVAGYLHMDAIDVHVGERVDASTVIGTSGNSGGVKDHLDFRVAKVTGDDAQKVAELISKGEYDAACTLAKGNHQGNKYGNFIDPKQYLAEIALAGQLNTKIESKASGRDVLADAKQKVSQDDVALLAQKGVGEDHEMLDHDISDSLGQMAALFGGENSQNGGLASLLSQMGSGGGMDIVGGLFSLAIMAMLSTFNGQSKEEKQAAVASLSKDLKGEGQDDETVYTVDRSERHKKSIDGKTFSEKGRDMFEIESDRVENAQNQEQQNQRGAALT